MFRIGPVTCGSGTANVEPPLNTSSFSGIVIYFILFTCHVKKGREKFKLITLVHRRLRYPKKYYYFPFYNTMISMIWSKKSIIPCQVIYDFYMNKLLGL
jgi:hypothetical protein